MNRDQPVSRDDHLAAATEFAAEQARGQNRRGRAFCQHLAEITDDWLIELFDEAMSQHEPRGASVALLAIGGYGRGELAPFSDLDLLLVHDVKPRKVAALVEPVASALWYPLWDSGVKLGHAVRSVKEQLSLASDDLDTATALLTARVLAGDDSLADDVMSSGHAAWTDRRDEH